MPRKILVFLTFLFLVPAAFPQTPPLAFGPEVVVGPKAVGSSRDLDSIGSLVASGDGAVLFFSHREHQGARDSSIRAVRIGRDGRPDLATLRVVVPKALTYDRPIAARSGNGFVLVWPSSGSLFASRVDADLTLRDPNGILLGSGGQARIACDDDRCAIAASNRVILLDSATAAPIATTVTGAPVTVNSVVARAGAGTFAVTWVDNADPSAVSLRAVRVNVSGSVEGPWLLDRDATLFGPAADFDDSAAVIVWTANHELRGTRIGALGEPAPVKKISTLGENDIVSAIGWNGHQHLAVVSYVILPDGPVIGGFVPPMLLFGRPLDASLNPAGNEVPISTMPALNWPPDVAAPGTDFLLVWDYGESNLGAATALRKIVIAEDGTPRNGDPAKGGSPLFTGPIAQAPMAVASSNDTYLGVWFAHDTPAVQHLYAARASGSGEVLDAPIALTSGRAVVSAVAGSDGRDFLVVWYDIDSVSYQNPRLMAARIDGFDGSVTSTPLSPDMMLTPGATVRWDGSAYVVPVHESDSAPHLLRLASDGSLISDTTLESGQGPALSYPYRVASSGDRTLLVWSTGEATNCTGDCVGTFAAIYDASGHLVSQPHRLFGPAGAITLAVRDNDFLMVNTLTDGSVQALRIGREGSASPAVKLGEWKSAYTDLLLVPLAARWLVVWEGKQGRQFTRWDPDAGTALPPGDFPFTGPMLLAKGVAGKAVMTYASDNAVILREVEEPAYVRRRGAVH